MTRGRFIGRNISRIGVTIEREEFDSLEQWQEALDLLEALRCRLQELKDSGHSIGLPKTNGTLSFGSKAGCVLSPSGFRDELPSTPTTTTTPE